MTTTDTTTTTTTTTPVVPTTVQLARLLTDHLAWHGLPEPASVTLHRGHDGGEIAVQITSPTLPDTAALLVAWADSLASVEVEVWWPPASVRVHLSVSSTLTGPACGAALRVYGSAAFDPRVFGEIDPDQHQTATLDQLRTWTTGPTGSGVTA